MDCGIPCPICKNENTQILATTNEWCYYCPKCDKRFNSKGKVRE